MLCATNAKASLQRLVFFWEKKRLPYTLMWGNRQLYQEVFDLFRWVGIGLTFGRLFGLQNQTQRINSLPPPLLEIGAETVENLLLDLLARSQVGALLHAFEGFFLVAGEVFRDIDADIDDDVSAPITVAVAVHLR